MEAVRIKILIKAYLGNVTLKRSSIAKKLSILINEGVVNERICSNNIILDYSHIFSVSTSIRSTYTMAKPQCCFNLGIQGTFIL